MRGHILQGSPVFGFAALLVMAAPSSQMPHYCATSLGGLAALGAGYSGQNVASAPPTPQATKWGLQPDSSTATYLVSRAVEGIGLHLVVLFLSFLVPLPY